nr:ribonuclease H-like domain-containing protein [Tanacetum cinerariifolium]
MKARTLLLQSLPEDHMADFHHLDDAREIWLAVKARFGGNEESKKMRKTMLKQEFSEFRVSEEEGLHKGYDRFQKILSKLNQMQAKPDNDDVNLKFLRALPPSWSFKIDVKGGSSYGSRGTVAPTHSASIGATSTPTKMGYFDQPNFEQVDQMDMEELDIKWQMAMLSLRINKFQKKAGRKINFNNKDCARKWMRRHEHMPKEGEQVYGLMAGFKLDFADLTANAAGSVYDVAAEFAMIGISPKAKIKKKEWEVKLVESLASPMPADSFSTVDVKILSKSDVKEPSPINGVSSCSIKENVKPISDLCNKHRIAGNIVVFISKELKREVESVKIMPSRNS